MIQTERSPEEIRSILDRLAELQIVDRELLQTRKQLASLPATLKRLESKMAEERALHEEALAGPADYELERRALEREVRELEQEIAAHVERRSRAKTNPEYNAATEEIEFLENKKDAAETRILEMIEEQEQHQKKAAEAQERFERFLAENEKEKKRILEQIRGKKEKIERLEAQRAHMCRSVPDDVLRLYERLSQRHPGDVVVPAVNSHCGGCHITLVSQKMVEIRQMKKLIQCEGCLRIFSGEEKSQ